MSTCQVRIMPHVPSKSSIGILAGFQPSHYLVLLLRRQGISQSSQSSERPIAPCHLQMLSQIFANRVEIFAVLQSQQILRVLLPTKFDGLILHYYYYPEDLKIDVETKYEYINHLQIDNLTEKEAGFKSYPSNDPSAAPTIFSSPLQPIDRSRSFCPLKRSDSLPDKPTAASFASKSPSPPGIEYPTI